MEGAMCKIILKSTIFGEFAEFFYICEVLRINMSMKRFITLLFFIPAILYQVSGDMRRPEAGDRLGRLPVSVADARRTRPRAQASAPGMTAPAPSIPAAAGTVGAPAKATPQDGREYVTLIDEDFSLFTEGSENSPTTTNIENVYDEIPARYTHIPGWHGRGIRQAGGMVCIGMVKSGLDGSEMTGQIETPQMDLTRDRGRAYLTLKVRPLVPDMDVLNVRWISPATDDNPLGSTGETQQFSISGMIWNTVDVALTGCPENASIQIYSEKFELLIDELKLEQCHPELDAPKALKWTEFTGDGFTAHWEPVEGADHYVLYCFYVRREATEEQMADYKYVNPGGSKGYELKETSYRFDGLKIDKVHYYYVTAVAPSGFVSQESQVVEVLDLTVPENIRFGNVDVSGFDMSWDAVYNAEGYGVQTILAHTAPHDEEYDLLNEKFDAIRNEGSIGNPYGNTMGYYDMDSYGMTRSGWVLYEGGVIDGGICLHNYTSEFGTYYEGELVSPIWLINNSTGDVTIEADFATLDAGVKPYVQVAVPVTIDGKTQWGLGAGGVIDQPIGKTWTHVKLQYKIKPGIVRFSFMATDGGWLYMDNLRISTKLPGGAVQLMPYQYRETVAEDGVRPSISMTTPDRTRDDAYSVTVMAARRRPGSSFFPVYINSEWSPEYQVPDVDWSGMEALRTDTDDVTVAVIAGGIAIDNPSQLPVTVYDPSGRVVSRVTSDTQITLAPGIYLVSHGGRTSKVAVR